MARGRNPWTQTSKPSIDKKPFSATPRKTPKNFAMQRVYECNEADYKTRRVYAMKANATAERYRHKLGSGMNCKEDDIRTAEAARQKTRKIQIPQLKKAAPKKISVGPKSGINSSPQDQGHHLEYSPAAVLRKTVAGANLRAVGDDDERSNNSMEESDYEHANRCPEAAIFEGRHAARGVASVRCIECDKEGLSRLRLHTTKGDIFFRHARNAELMTARASALSFNCYLHDIYWSHTLSLVSTAMHKTLFFCLPKYKPNLGHEDIGAHSKSQNGHFYALVGKEWAGVVSSMYVFAAHKVSVLAKGRVKINLPTSTTKNLPPGPRNQ
ncbi:hypothetical protein B0H13DRAFT_1929956 [Mycena leptocephala]|nr:hypothetical protein B0H13DRAFT_1929956 [Mycena leptocephala]